MNTKTVDCTVFGTPKFNSIVSLILSLAMLLTLTVGLDFSAFADGNIFYHETVSIESAGDKFELEFTPDKSGFYRIYSVSEYDTYGRIIYSHSNGDNTGSSGHIDDDDSGEDFNFLFYEYLYNYDSYTLVVSLFSEEETGQFEIFIEFDHDENEFEYEVQRDGTAEITGFIGGAAELDIPSEIDGHIVTRIGYRAFYGCHNIKSVIIPDTVKYIDEDAFCGCTSLVDISIPDSVIEIGEGAFGYCTSLSEITLPNKIGNVEKSLFLGCEALTEIIIPASVKYIGDWAFAECRSLKNIIISAGVEDIGFGILQRCDGLETIIVDKNNKFYDSRENCNAIIETASNTIIEACYNTRIPNSVTAIGDGAFGWRKTPETMVIPAHIIKIDAQAFAGSNLKAVTVLNRNCYIDNFVYPPNTGGAQWYTFDDEVIIYGYKNSTAQVYAETHGNKFIELEENPAQLKFGDLTGYDKYNDYVLYTSVYNSFITGTNPPANNVFSPKTSINRAMFVTILYRMAGSPYDNGKNPYDTKSPFADIKNTSAYYYNAACWALDEGVTDQIIFKPADYVSREQAATMLFRYAQENGVLGDEAYKDVKLSAYHDYSAIHNWAEEPMKWANYNGMITGTEQGYANPQGATQRIHATKILYGFGVVCNIGNFE